MRNKIIFALLTIALFIVSGVVGYYGPDWLRERRLAQEAASFVPSGVPQTIEKAFGARFGSMQKATEAKRLSDTAFQDKRGKMVRLSDFNGRLTLVNFWATWCPPCVIELPWLDTLSKQYEGRMNVVGIALEQGKKPADIMAFLDRREIGDFAAYTDESGALAKELALRGLPTTYLLGHDGLVLYRFEGEADWTSAEAQAFFDMVLLQNR